MERICSSCNDLLPIERSGFKSIKLNRRHHQCKKCQQVYYKAHYRNNKEIYNRRRCERHRRIRAEGRARLREYLVGKVCIDCSESDPTVLELDHVRGKKVGTIGTLIHKGHTWRRIEEELGKCEVRCANCHRRKTAREGGWTRKVFGA